MKHLNLYNGNLIIKYNDMPIVYYVILDAMCIIVWCFNPNTTWKFILVSLRDENFDRPTKIATYYPEEKIIGSRDQDFFGMQIGISLTGKIAAVTNLNGYLATKTDQKSRGLLVVDYLTGVDDHIMLNEDILYKPFNLFCAMTADDVLHAYYRQWSEHIVIIKNKEIYGIDNSGLDANSYRLNRAKELFQYVILTHTDKNALIDNLFDLLNDKEPGMENDSIFKMPKKTFITNQIFGTRTQTVILIDNDNKVTFVERNFNMDSLLDHNPKDRVLPSEIKHTLSICYYDSNKWIENLYEYDIIE